MALLAQHTNRCSASSVAALVTKYKGLASDLLRSGFDGKAARSRSSLDEEALLRSRQSFVISDGNIRPRRYAEAPWSLPPRAVRLVAFRVSDDERVSDANTSRVARLAMAAGREMLAILPSGAEAWLPPDSSLHATLFHPGLDPGTSASSLPPALAAGPSPASLRNELATLRRLAGALPASLTFAVDRVVLTRSGVMLLLLKPTLPFGFIAAGHHASSGSSSRYASTSACVESLRGALAAALPNATSKQTSGLVHVSLLRLVGLPAGFLMSHTSLATFARSAAALCEKWSARLSGMRVTAHE